jgi:hypothetical protein
MVRLSYISESEFKKKYAYEIHSPVVVALLGHMRDQEKNQNVYLVENSKDGALLLADMLAKIGSVLAQSRFQKLQRPC